MDEKFTKNLERALQVKRSLKDQYCSIEVNHDWTIRVYCHPDEEHMHEAVSAATPLIGRLDKKVDVAGYFNFSGANEVFEVIVMTPQKCAIIGHRIERKPITKIIETGEFEEVKVPVTDCDLKSGRATPADYTPLEAAS